MIVISWVYWWQLKLIIFGKNGIIAKQDFSQKELFISTWKSVAVVIAIKSILCEVYCKTPESCSFSKPIVEAYFSIVNLLRRCFICSVPKKFNFRIFTKFISDLFHFCLVDLPQTQVLYDVYFFYYTCWHCLS